MKLPLLRLLLQLQWPTCNRPCTWALRGVNTIDSPFLFKKFPLSASKRPHSTGSILSDQCFFLAFAGFFSAFLGLYLWPLFPLHSPRYQTALQKGWVEFTQVFCLAEKLFCFDLSVHALQQSTHPLVHAHGHLSLAVPFLGGPRGHVSLQLFSVAAPLAGQSFKYSCITTLQLLSKLLSKLFHIFHPLPEYPVEVYNLPQTKSMVQLCSQLWAMTSSISLFFLTRNHGLFRLVCFHANVIEYLRCTIFGLEEENSVVSINRPGPCLMDFTVWLERNTWMR